MKPFTELLKRKENILTIEINDEEIDGQIARLILESEKTVRELQTALKLDDISSKDAATLELLQIFEKIADKVGVLISDIKKIRLKELQEKRYVRISDEQYLLDKISQLGAIRESLNSLLEIMRENPSDQDYETGVLDQVFANLNRMIDSMNKIKADDNQLRHLYEQLKG
ncbi:MAG: hypothetical protein V1743_01190 [Nanoarchaeota archaeon]